MIKYVSLFLILCISVIVCANLEHADIDVWENGYFIQKNVKHDNEIIKVFFENKWDKYTSVDLPDKFMEWSVERRMETFSNIREGIPPKFAGPHNGIVATYGIKRNDTKFKINNAIKGMGFCPKEDKIDELIKTLETTIDSGFMFKLAMLENLYKNVDEYYTRDKLLSLELYAEPKFETGTFLNQMVNPCVSIVFLDIPSFEIKAVAEMFHPGNPELSDYESKIITYVNLIHSYFHGEFNKMFIAVLYNVIEVYDNSPGKSAKGIRIVPLIP